MKRITLSLITMGLISATGPPASATSPYAGCPPSYRVWIVGTMNPPYRVPGEVDGKGNNDNKVCAKQIDDRTFQYNGQTYPIYNFIDNTVARAA